MRSARSSPLGVCRAGGVNFSLFSRTATSVELLLFDRADDPKPRESFPSIPLRIALTTTGTLSCQACSRASFTATACEGPSAPERGLRFDPAKVLLDPYGRGVVVPKNYDREAAKRAGDNAATAMKSVVVDPRAYDWEGDLPLRPAVGAHDHLRDARPRLHPPSEFRRRREDARHLRGPDREDPVSQGPRHHGGGAAAGVSVRCPGLPAGQDQLLGLCAHLVLRPAPGVQLAPRSARPGGRISRHGQGPAPRGHRGHSRRGVQPHGRRAITRADAQLPRHRQSDLLHPRRRRPRYANYTGCGNTLNANHPSSGA